MYLKQRVQIRPEHALDVDDDNEPAPENIPAAGAPIDCTTNLHGQQWGWDGTCHQKSKHHVDVSPQIKDFIKSDLCTTSKLDMFLLFFPLDFVEDIIVKETSRILVQQAHQPMPMGEFIQFLGCIFFMSCFSGVD
jgi:hypothetical protein